MDYQTMLTNAIEYLTADMTNVFYVLAGVAVAGAVNGIRRSLQHCKGRTGRIL